MDVIIAVTVMMTGCSNQSEEDLKAENVFCSFTAQRNGGDYQTAGTVYLSSERDVVTAEAASETEIFISGTLTRKEGELKLLFEDSEA